MEELLNDANTNSFYDKLKLNFFNKISYFCGLLKVQHFISNRLSIKGNSSITSQTSVN